MKKDLQKRLAQARTELEHADMPGVDDMIVVNDDLENACETLNKLCGGCCHRTMI